MEEKQLTLVIFGLFKKNSRLPDEPIFGIQKSQVVERCLVHRGVSNVDFKNVVVLHNITEKSRTFKF